MKNLPARLPSGRAIAPIAPHAVSLPDLPRIGAMDLYDALQTDARCLNTRLARRWDIELLRQFLGAAGPAEACALFIAHGRGTANALGLAFRDAGKRRGVANSTVNRANATLRRLVKLARRFDLIDWALDLDDLPHETYRDTRGPALAGWRKLWKACEAAGDSAKAHRDRCLIRVIHDGALRKSEALGIDVADIDLAGERVTLSGPAAAMIRAWLAVRGPLPGPLFTVIPGGHFNAGHATVAAFVARLRDDGFNWVQIANRLNVDGLRTREGFAWNRISARRAFMLPRHVPLHARRRMNERDVNRLLHELSVRAGLDRPVKPHSLRHQSITRALDLTNGNIREVRKFARHVKVETTLKYDDQREDVAGKITRILGDDV